MWDPLQPADIAVKTDASIASINAANGIGIQETVSAAIDLALVWEGLARPGALVVVWECLFQSLSKMVDIELASEEISTVTVSALDSFLHQMVLKMDRPDGPYKNKLLELRGVTWSKAQSLSQIDPSQRFFVALDEHMREASTTSFKHSKIVSYECKDTFASPEHLVKIRAAMKDATVVVSKLFIGLTSEMCTAFSPQVDGLRRGIDMCHLFQRKIHSFIVDPVEEDTVLAQWFDRAAQKLEVISIYVDFMEHGNTPSQQHSTEEAVEEFQAMWTIGNISTG